MCIHYEHSKFAFNSNSENNYKVGKYLSFGSSAPDIYKHFGRCRRNCHFKCLNLAFILNARTVSIET